MAGLAADRALPAVEVVVAALDMASARPFLSAARTAAPPGALVLPLIGPGLPGGLAEWFDLFRGRQSPSGPVAFVCVGGACRPPTSDPDEMREMLTAAAEASKNAYLTAAG